MKSLRMSLIPVLLILLSASVSIGSAQQKTSRLTITGSAHEAFEQEVRKQLVNNNYEWLESEAKKLRDSKERLPGGYWKLRVLYSTIEDIAKLQSTEELWQAHIARIERWVRQRPTSAMPRIILAEVLRKYGWKARGQGRANTVKPENWAPFNERHERTSKLLAEAAALEEKCPEWYVTALLAARVPIVDRDAFERLYEQAVAVEPYYYYLYQAKAGYLLPQWYGERGEWERFAEIAANQVGGEQGDIILFSIYAEMLFYNDLDFMNSRQAIAPRVLAGFRAIDKLYGSSPQRLNEACLFSFFANENTAPAELMKRIGNAFDVNVWKDASTFNIFRQEALMRSGELPRYRQSDPKH